MATSVTKFFADDGTEFQTMEEALTYDLIQQLKKEFGFADAVCDKIASDSGRLHYLLGQFIEKFPGPGIS